MKIKLVPVVRSKIGKTGASKRLKSKIVRLFIIEQLKWTRKMKNK